MPLFKLTDELIFPNPELSLKDGLLAVGGDLSMERLLLAYKKGIFPWYDDQSPILWWSPNPRMVLFPKKLKISKSLWQVIRQKKFEVKVDEDFSSVIKNCATVPRADQPGTWITNEMIQAYINLHENGFAHSFEAYYNGQLVGGLYGVSLGRIFFGESMFHKMSDASKVALYYLTEKVKSWKFLLIDAQQDTPHMRRMGAKAIPRKDFLALLDESSQYHTYKGKWSL
jgi:leucyl/phenylalanyl-tRNA--protein transferase